MYSSLNHKFDFIWRPRFLTFRLWDSEQLRAIQFRAEDSNVIVMDPYVTAAP